MPQAPFVTSWRHVSAATTFDDVVDVLADWFSEVHPRTADLFRIIRDASAVDSEVAELRRRRERARFENYHHAAEALAKHGHSGGRPVEDVAAAIWSFAHPETYAFLTTTANWDLPRYRAWIRDQLSALG